MGARLSILVLDDDIAFLESFGELLAREGHSIFPATTGHQAIEIVQRRRIDLSFLDFDLPDADGTETLLRIHQFWPKLPAIFVSGNSSATLEEVIFSAGGLALLRKPFETGQLRLLMKEIVQKHCPNQPEI